MPQFRHQHTFILLLEHKGVALGLYDRSTYRVHTCLLTVTEQVAIEYDEINQARHCVLVNIERERREKVF